jgi:hypothetical protein
MRLFQNSAFYPSYLPRLNKLAASAVSFADRRAVFLNDRFGALHFLRPVLEGAPDAFFTNGDDEILQRLWASELGVPSKPTLEAILLAQIEHHRPKFSTTWIRCAIRAPLFENCRAASGKPCVGAPHPRGTPTSPPMALYLEISPRSWSPGAAKAAGPSFSIRRMIR